MTLKAPVGTLHTPLPQRGSLERELWFESLGCCWALSVKNIEGRFPIQLMIDLSRYEGPSGNMVQALGASRFADLVQAFQLRVPHNRDGRSITERHANHLLKRMNVDDLLCFMAGMSDTIEEFLRPAFFWDDGCQSAWLSLKFYSLNPIESKLESTSHKARFATLLTDLVITGQAAYRKFGHASEFDHF